ncbi:MAG: PH domain-containing protein [Rikenellaceae bacterium]
MNRVVYKYHSNKRTLITTLLYFVLLLAASVLIWLMYVGGYFSAWFISVVVAIIALIVISMPRRIIVDEQTLTIACVLEIVEIPITEIVYVRKVEPSEIRWTIPIFASPGFLGHFGYYLDLTTFDIVRLYATERQNMVEILDIYDDRYYLSCRQSDQLIEQIISTVE